MIKILMVVLLMILLGCAPHTVDVIKCVVDKPAGFWMGLWHGMIAGITFFIFISIFINDDIKIYAIHNNGGWYNFGFLLGIDGLIGGGSNSRRRR